MIEEVLDTDTDECARQYVVSAYMLSPPSERTEAVRAAINEVSSITSFGNPIQEMERAAVEPLSELNDFLLQWRTLIERGRKSIDSRTSDWDTQEDQSKSHRKSTDRGYRAEATSPLRPRSTARSDLRWV